MRGGDLNDDAFEQRAKAGMWPGARLDMTGVGEDDEAAGDALGAFQQRQRMREMSSRFSAAKSARLTGTASAVSKSSEKVVATAASKT
ncbi:hypothetical protein [Bordetella trematum]|uniref:hypothetical protein n=1 Tax=Bordetella trematum TaxID=123899 RepID=UPI003AF36AEC